MELHTAHVVTAWAPNCINPLQYFEQNRSSQKIFLSFLKAHCCVRPNNLCHVLENKRVSAPAVNCRLWHLVDYITLLMQNCAFTVQYFKLLNLSIKLICSVTCFGCLWVGLRYSLYERMGILRQRYVSVTTYCISSLQIKMVPVLNCKLGSGASVFFNENSIVLPGASEWS